MTRRFFTNIRFSLLSVLALLTFAASAQSTKPSSGASLDDCFMAALRRSEVVATQDELITQAEERYRQAVGGILPALSGTANYLIQEDPQTSLGSSIFPSQQPLAKVTLSQPIFRGFREFAGIRQQKNLVLGQVYARQSAAIQLFRDVALSFYTVLSLERDLRNLERELGYYAKRVRELDARIKIGRSRKSEVLTVQVTMANLRAQREQVRGQVAVNRDVLAFLTGFAPDFKLKDPATDILFLESPRPVDPLEKYLGEQGNRPDIKADTELLRAANEGVMIARGAHLPSIDLTSNYYFTRSGSLKDVNWDVQAALTLPIYVGGVIQSQVRQAASQYQQAELALSQTIRLADREIRSFFHTLTADLHQVRSLGEASKLAERNYNEQTRDYRMGLVTNLDVLQALTAFQESLRSLDRVKYSVALDHANLDSAVTRQPRFWDGVSKEISRESEKK